MDISYPLTEAAARSRADAADSGIAIPQLGKRAILKVWAAAALPMAALAWILAPLLTDQFSGDGHVPMAKALIVSLTIGMVWQFILVAVLVRREQGTFRYATIREALWLRSPRSPRSGRVGGRLWLVVIPLIIAFTFAQELVAIVPAPENREFATLLDMFTIAYPSKRYRSAWIGIAVHSAQSVFLAILILTFVV